ncbi:DUF3164 family protein [Empedobacter sp. GD03797]|uniref:DUF3164 family protein n=1 Tax=Empedobacter sp. GD03797 TaxID=2975382 RepID=UPI00244BD475|nr:DUF3164 family protein [Empedobacter sp. GD03797]MDH1883937.1 DUF3164 family protein [Empedobacter sp. GD03797]
MEASIMNKPASEMSVDELLALANQKQEAELKQAKQRKDAYFADKNNFLNDVVSKYQEVQDILKSLKKEAITHAENFNRLMYEIENKAVKDAKSFKLENETVRLMVEEKELFSFTDEAIVHINSIRDIFRKKFEGRNKAFYNLLDGILMKNSKGEYDPKLLTKARKQVKEIGDEELISEFDKLTDCQKVVGSAKYIRVYTKDAETKKWNDITLNFSSL